MLMPGNCLLWQLRCCSAAGCAALKPTPAAMRTLRRLGIFSWVQIQELQHALTAKHPGWLGFCHNDLQYGNMLMDVMNPMELPEESPAEQVNVQPVTTAAALHGCLTCPTLAYTSQQPQVVTLC